MPKNNVTIQYKTTLSPLNRENIRTFADNLYKYTETIISTRQEKVSNDTPLLSSRDNPYYTQSQFDTLIGYSIDIRNIYKWMRFFLLDGEQPPQDAQSIIFDLPPEKYTYENEILEIQTETDNLQFELTESPPFDLSELKTTLTLKYSKREDLFWLTFEDSASLEEMQDFTPTINSEQLRTTYDVYQSQLHGFDVEMHQPFAIYSPTVDYETVSNLVDEQCPEGAIIIITNDEWKVCAKSTDDTDYVVDVSIVELLNEVDDVVESHYEEFAYPRQYIHLPELQFVHSLPESTLNDSEQKLLRTLPYAIPFGDESLLYDKIRHANKFATEQVQGDIQELLNYEQFLEIDDKSSFVDA